MKDPPADERAAKRAQATAEGKNKTGNSNQDVKGSHATNKSTKNKNRHQGADTRRAREQKAADEYKKKH